MEMLDREVITEAIQSVPEASAASYPAALPSVLLLMENNRAMEHQGFTILLLTSVKVHREDHLLIGSAQVNIELRGNNPPLFYSSAFLFDCG